MWNELFGTRRGVDAASRRRQAMEYQESVEQRRFTLGVSLDGLSKEQDDKLRRENDKQRQVIKKLKERIIYNENKESD